MSLGSNFDDSAFERAAVLQEAAVQVVLKGLSESKAVSVAERLSAQRRDAEQSGQVATDEQGYAVSYHDASLNPDPVPESQLEAVDTVYRELCEKEGFEPL